MMSFFLGLAVWPDSPVWFDMAADVSWFQWMECEDMFHFALKCLLMHVAVVCRQEFRKKGFVDFLPD